MHEPECRVPIRAGHTAALHDFNLKPAIPDPPKAAIPEPTSRRASLRTNRLSTAFPFAWQRSSKL